MIIVGKRLSTTLPPDSAARSNPTCPTTSPGWFIKKESESETGSVSFISHRASVLHNIYCRMVIEGYVRKVLCSSDCCGSLACTSQRRCRNWIDQIVDTARTWKRNPLATSQRALPCRLLRSGHDTLLEQWRSYSRAFSC